MLISDEYRKLNRQLHKQNPGYGGGHKWAEYIHSIAEGEVLDYGCGKGKLKKMLPDLDIREYDPAIPGKEDMPEPADLVVCNDVLEHVEPEYLDNVLNHLISLTKKRLLLVIACRPGKKVLPDGRLAHRIVENEEWWIKKLSAFGKFTVLPPKASRELAVMLEK
jgi:SAM-dependent methyltransferase